jgi:hypothetical protein
MPLTRGRFAEYSGQAVLSRVGKADAVNFEPSVDARRSTPQMQRVPPYLWR